MEAVAILPELAIPAEELRFATARSSGPGGQNVNKVETRVTLLFDVAGSPTLSDEQKARVAAALPTRVNRDGVLRVMSQVHRSQAQNREAAVARFGELLRGALTPRKRRRPTRVSAGARRRRAEEKRRTSERKRERAKPRADRD